MGKSFGEYSFFSDKPREISLKSEQVTHVAFITRKEFLALISNFEEDFVKLFNQLYILIYHSLGKILYYQRINRQLWE